MSPRREFLLFDLVSDGLATFDMSIICAVFTSVSIDSDIQMFLDSLSDTGWSLIVSKLL
jgi:hypothetical protein